MAKVVRSPVAKSLVVRSPAKALALFLLRLTSQHLLSSLVGISSLTVRRVL